MTIRVAVVDDEPLARQRIVELLRGEPDMQVVAECADGEEAVERIVRLRPDLVFLDVQMPEMDGFEVLAALGPSHAPVVVFVTAYDQFALQAFEAQALDYLLKPFASPRFHRMLDRARAQVARGRSPALEERLERLLGALPGGPYLERFVVRTADRIRFVRACDVEWIEAEGNYVRLHERGRSHLLRASLASVAGRLDPRCFLRVHRSAVVSLDRVREVQVYGKGTYVLVLEDGTKVTSSVTYREGVERLIAG
jgi:two-component system LytT family response regulator